VKVDRSRFFLSPAVTPLAYTGAYAGWSEERRRRSNQLTALAFNEGIAFFERTFSASLVAVRRELAQEDELAGSLDRFLADEARHAAAWDELNRAAEPRYYRGRKARPIVPISPRLARLLGHLVARPRRFPVVFWLMLALEEHSLHISRCCLRRDAEALDPTFSAAYREHARDEARHVQVDRRLIERFYAPLPWPLRWLNAALFHALLRGGLLAPGRRARAIVGRLIEEQPELAGERPRIERELAHLGRDPGYVAMMYSARATPLFFAQLGQFPELRSLQRRLAAPAGSQRRSAAP
jgi:para-aminobenzoate N-oxygenase AurF